MPIFSFDDVCILFCLPFYIILFYFVSCRIVSQNSLIEAGYTAESIGTAIVAVDKARSERLESVRSALDGPTFSGAVQTTGSAILKAGRKGSKMLLGGVSAAVSGIKMGNIKLPRRKSMINPAC